MAVRLAALAVLLPPVLAAASAEAADSLLVHCRVFHDLDADGIEDTTEPGLASVRITNGEEIRTTDADGRLDLTLDLDVYRFVTLTIPAGHWPTTPWYQRFLAGQAAPDTVIFGLKTFPATASDPIRWVHITDTQTQTWGDPIEIVSDLQSINDLPEPGLFVINTGDLVATGSDTTHWENYLDQLAASDSPVFPVVGNHDILGTNPPLANYERYVGPPYYDLVAGSWRFVIYNNEDPEVATPSQDLWLDEVFGAATPGERIVVLQHRMLAQRPSSVADYWASRGVIATFSGHWHALHFSEHGSGILDFNLSRTAASRRRSPGRDHLSPPRPGSRGRRPRGPRAGLRHIEPGEQSHGLGFGSGGPRDAHARGHLTLERRSRRVGSARGRCRRDGFRDFR
jgi:hypothetical protein